MMAEGEWRGRGNLWLLVAAHGLLSGQLAVHMILGGLAGALLAERPEYATLPISAMIVATMVVTAPLSLFMQRFGRRAGFLLGAVSGAAGGSLCAYALAVGSFQLLLAGSLLIGGYQAANSYFRFAAADTAPAAFRPKAISWVLAGGLFGAIVGPEIVRQTRDLLSPVPYAGAYLSVVVVNLVGVLPVLFLNLPKPPRAPERRSSRPLVEILRTSSVATAILCAMISYSMMTLVMTSTPLAMVTIGCSPDQAADVVRWHVVAMFLPSFFTGSLIVRFGHIRVIATGFALLAGAGAVALSGVGLPHFYVALVLLGVGWNFGFVGSTSLLTASHAPEDRARVQGINDVLLFASLAVASFGSGALLSTSGWSAVQYAMLPAITLAAFGLLRLGVRTGPRRWLRI